MDGVDGDKVRSERCGVENPLALPVPVHHRGLPAEAGKSNEQIIEDTEETKMGIVCSEGQ